MNKIPASFFVFVVIILTSFTAAAQNSFIAEKKASFRLAGILESKEDTLQKQFEAKGLQWPAKYVYIRSFKYDRQLEVWVKNTSKETYKLFKTYKVCMQSGTMGPNGWKGDYQVPEGFYYINEFNPNSNYHLALGLNYPNASDKILSDSFDPGNAIYIHGNCVSTVVLPLADDPIEEVYMYCRSWQNQVDRILFRFMYFRLSIM